MFTESNSFEEIEVSMIKHIPLYLIIDKGINMYKQKLLHLILSVIAVLHCTLSCTNSYEYVYQLSNQIMISRALYVAADLELADYLQTNPLSLQELGSKVDVNIQALNRLLRCLIEHGIFAYDKNNLICNNDKSVFLCKNHAQTIRPFILHDDPTRWNAIGNLGYSIKTGNASFDGLYGTDYFLHLKTNPVLSKRFDEAMTIISQQEDERIAQMIDFQGIVADIGGGKGQLLQQIAQYNNNNSVTALVLFDLQQVQDNILLKSSSITQVSGSFFNSIPIQADVFILKRILHDWDDQKALHILSNVATAMNDENILYIVDAVIDQCQDKKLILDIDLRLLSIFGGQERSKREFELLCNVTGLEIVEINDLTSISHIIKCRKRKRA